MAGMPVPFVHRSSDGIRTVHQSFLDQDMVLTPCQAVSKGGDFASCYQEVLDGSRQSPNTMTLAKRKNLHHVVHCVDYQFYQ